MNLVYIADPLCSWCYGFGPELARVLAAHPGTSVDLVMGGLRPFNREPATAQFIDTLRGHWARVAEASGLAFTDAALRAPGFTYDTEPACRAVVTARTLEPSRALACMTAIQGAFYRDGRDATRAEVLADAAAAAGYERGPFLEHLESPAAREATLADFRRSQSLGVRGFPTLAAERGGSLHLLTAGYVPAATIEARLEAIAGMRGEP